jgi:hypothetical protein
VQLLTLLGEPFLEDLRPLLDNLFSTSGNPFSYEVHHNCSRLVELVFFGLVARSKRTTHSGHNLRSN